MIAFLLIGRVEGKEKNNDLKYTLYLAYDSNEVIRDQSQVATIVSGEGLDIDDILVMPQNMRYTNYTPSRPNWVIADILPGKHNVKITQLISGRTIIMTPIEYDFQAGRVYRMGIKFFKLVIEEHPSADFKKEISTLRSSAEFKDPEKE